MCKSGKSSNRSRCVCNLVDSDSESIFTVHAENKLNMKRKLYASLKIGDSLVNCLLDCGKYST